MGRARLLLGLSILAASRVVAAAPQEPQEELEALVARCLAAVNDNGLSQFEGLRFPCYVLGFAGDGVIAIFKSPADLPEPAAAVPMTHRKPTFFLAGRAGIATVDFQPEGGGNWATAFLVLIQDADKWFVQAVGFSPTRYSSATDRLELRRLGQDFASAWVGDAPGVFPGLAAPFLSISGLDGTLRIVEHLNELPMADTVPLVPVETRIVTSDLMGAVTMEVTTNDNPPQRKRVALLSAKLDGVWQVVGTLFGESE